jgi:hypothetical protein
MSSVILQIEEGTFALSLVDKAAVGYLDTWQAPGGATLADVTLADYDTASPAWSCQATSGALTATANLTTVEVPATFCEPAQSIPQPASTSFSLDMTFLQDANIVDGINRYLFENDTKEAYVFYGLAGEDPPKMIGRVRLIAGTIGGAARSTLTFDVSLPFSRKPDAEFGDTTASQIVNGDGTVGPPPVATAAASYAPA